MPKRLGYRFEEVCSEENCIAAVQEVIRSKGRHSTYSRIYETQWDRITQIMERRSRHPRRYRNLEYLKEHAEEIGRQISRELREGTWTPQPYRERAYYDHLRGKQRLLRIPCLYDQCVHHAVMRVTIPDLQRRFSYHDCGSVPGAGQSRAADLLLRQMKAPARQQPKYAANLDIHHFFESCGGSTVMACLQRVYKDRKFLDLHRQILDSMGGGLAIGFFPSPWYANLVLEYFVDRPLKQHYGKAVKIARYMDDMVLTSRNRRTLRRVVESVTAWIHRAGMTLKPNWQLYPIRSRAVPFLSYRYFPGYALVRKPIMYRITRTARKAGRGLSPMTAMAVQSYNGILKRCSSMRLKQEHIYPYIRDTKCRRLIRDVTHFDRVLTETGSRNRAAPAGRQSVCKPAGEYPPA